MKRTCQKMLCAAFLMVVIVLFALPSLAENARNPLAMDMVIVIENSVRMNGGSTNTRKLDRDGLRFDAAAALISMCDAKYSRANYFLFNKDLYVYSETATGNVIQVTPDDIALFDISLPVHKPQRQSIMETLNGEKIRNGYGTRAGTDIGKAFAAAVAVQTRETGNGNRKIILLLTSGNNNLDSASVQMARDAKKIADEQNIEVYAVALTDTSSTLLLQELVSKPDNYQFANGPEDLVDVYRNFFAAMIGSDPMESRSVKLDENQSEIQLNIPNNSVAEVNIILPLKQVDDLILTDPNGKTITKTEDNVMVSKSKNFISYKLISPQSSTYRLSYASKDEKNIVVQYVFSYGVQVSTAVNAETINKHDPVTISAKYMVDGMPSDDEKLYNIPATVTLKKGSRVISVTEMEHNQQGYQLTYDDLGQYGTGTYTADIHFEGDGLKREGETVTFELVNNEPELVSRTVTGDKYNTVINVPGEADSYDPNKKSQSWDLNSFVKDINGDKLHAEILSNTADAVVDVNGMTLTVKPKENTATSGDIRVVVKDVDEAVSPELVFHVIIDNYESRYDSYTAHFDPVQKIEKNSTCNLTLRLYNAEGNEIRQDDQLPEQVLATISETGMQPFDLTMTREGAHWRGSFATGEKSSEYTASATIQIGQKQIKADSLIISSENKAPTLKIGAKQNNVWNVTINEPSEMESYKAQQHSWNLSDLVEDLNGDAVTFEIDQAASDANVNASINPADQTLTVSTRLNTETDGLVVVNCHDNDNAEGPVLSFHITVVSREEKYKLYTADLENKGHGKDTDIVFTLTVKDENGLIVTGDDNLPAELEANYILDSEPRHFTMTRGTDGKWTGIIHTENTEKTYKVMAAVKVSENISIIAPEIEVGTENNAPTVKKEPNASGRIPAVFQVDPFLIWSQETGEIVIEDLNEFFEDKDGDALTFSVTPAREEVSLKDNRLAIRGLTETSEDITFTITAQDNDKASVESKPISFSVKSLRKQGIITLAAIAAAIIILMILIQLVKPKYPNASFDVMVNNVPFENGTQLPKGSMAKKKVKLQPYAPTMAKSEYGTDIHTALGSIILKPGYGKTVKVDASKANGINVRINGKDQRKGTLANNGKLAINRLDKTVVFELKVRGAKMKPAKTVAKSTTGNPARTANQSSSHTGSGART